MMPRNNGLRASAYAALIEIEESLGDPMLEALAARQIAAYVQPTPGPGGTTRLTLYVDALQRAPAGAVLAGLTPAMAGDPPADSEPPRDVVAPDPTADAMADDAAFAALVEAFHRTPDERTWPDAEDLPAPAPEQPQQSPTARPADTVLPAVPPRRITKKFDPATDLDRRRPGTPVPAPKSEPKSRPDSERQRDAFDRLPAEAAGADELSDDEEHYVPPPLPRLDPPPFAIRWALVGLMLGLAMLLVPTFFDFGHRTSMDVAGVLFVLGSGGILVSRLRDRSPDDPDDGAVV